MNVFVAEPVFGEHGEEPLQLLREGGFGVALNPFRRMLRRQEMAEWLGPVEAVIAGLEAYDEEVLQNLPHLRCISRCGSGTDSVDLGAARRRNVAVLTTHEEVVEPVAQMTVGFILALARNLGPMADELRNGTWNPKIGNLLAEWNVGLIGFGRIGRAVEKHLRSFGPTVLVCDPFVAEKEMPPGVERLELDALLRRSDLVSLHVARPRSEGFLIERPQFALMKPGARMVNTSRGFLIDEDALCHALDAGRVSAAALDVFDVEPYQGALRKYPQVMCTPHIASFTRASRRSMELRSAANIVDFFQRS